MDMNFYSAIIFVEVFTAIVMVFLTSGNLVITKEYRRIFCIEYIMLMFIAVTEWLNTIMNGLPEEYRQLHYLVKVAEFSLTPALPCVLLIYLASKKVKVFAEILMFGNIALQIFSVPTHFVFYMDENNSYQRASGYIVFVAIYFISTAMLIYGMVMLSKKYQSSNRLVLIIGCLFAGSGIGIQLVNANVRTSWLTVELAIIMSYIYIEGMFLQSDRMTGMLNRFSYEKHIEEINYRTAIIIFDVDNFKSINDSYGHSAGDAALIVIANTIKKYFAKDGFCYRIGGDEFCVILRKKSPISKGTAPERLDQLIDKFNKKIAKLKSEDPRITGASIGYAFTDETETPQLAFEIADKNMYAEKQKHHSDY